jgi:hypothetical protein
MSEAAATPGLTHCESRQRRPMMAALVVTRAGLDAGRHMGGLPLDPQIR